MKVESTFVAERAAAQHCAELLRPASPPIALLPLVDQLGGKLARLLGPALAPLMGVAPTVEAGPASKTDCASHCAANTDLAAHCLLGVGNANSPLIATIEAGAAFQLVDRMFGGRGIAPRALPTAFPTSAQLMVTRIESVLLGPLTETLGAASSLRRADSLAQLEAFAPAEHLATLQLTVTPQGSDPWSVTLALPLNVIETLLGAADNTGSARLKGSADPSAAPFADVPLPLTAVLVDMAVSMATIAALEPGAVIPVAVSRRVPLRIGRQTIAHGSVGALDDCAALQLTHIA